MYADPFDSNYIRLRKNTGIYDELNDPYSMTFSWTTDGVEQERYYIRRRERFGYEFAQKKSKNVGCLLDAEEITVSFFPTNGNIFDSATETESVPEYLVE
jgi:SPRY domain.